jgi:hypothetical protein
MKKTFKQLGNGIDENLNPRFSMPHTTTSVNASSPNSVSNIEEKKHIKKLMTMLEFLILFW